ncbi:hypothetical protein C8N46_11216 [Kordia periserrulae]|uniref:YD repeat-containing protein n=1 Tax=Kordia periserrulae TaxID=701523 RepID=A0A2T6BRL4_9FLAO|nr:hypothetical protein [Kordia periserrulae]PTX58708.1 hypothetical protein C8N46_11216 [Kordia periserrulae]
MKIRFLLTVTILFMYSLSAQVSEYTEVLVKNKVKSVTEKMYYNNKKESCSTTHTTYDNKGNCIKWDFERIDSYFEYEYDEKNRCIATIRTSKSDSTDVYVIKKEYDEHGNVSYNHPDAFRNFYDEKNRLVKSVMLDEDSLTNFYKTFEYDVYDNLIEETHYEKGEMANLICYEYDAQLRLVAEKEFDESRIRFFNDEYANFQPIEYLSTKIMYDAKGRVKEKYQYYSDPCLSLEGHYTFKKFYKSNGLAYKTDMFFKDRRILTIRYTYTFY